MKNLTFSKQSIVAFFLTVALLTLLFISNVSVKYVSAAPALNEWQELSQPSGETFQARIEGDEFTNWYITSSEEVIIRDRDGYWKYAKTNDNNFLVPTEQRVGSSNPPLNTISHEEWVRIALKNREMTQPIALSPFLTSPSQPIIPSPMFSSTSSDFSVLSTSSEPNVPDVISPHPTLVLLVSFSDVSIRYSEAEWANAMFGTTGKTVRTYYEENSNGKGFYFSPANESFGTVNDGVVKVTLNRPHPNTRNNTGSLNQQVVRDALIAADPFVNFASFDKNGNGHLEFGELHIVTIIAGYEASSGSSTPSVWGHRWSLWSSSVAAPILDGVSVSQSPYGGYTQQGEVQTTNGEHMATIGILAHELGHDIGLMDVYDISGRTSGVGIHSLMAGGSWGRASGDIYSGQTPTHIDPYQKMLLGLVNPIDATEGFYTLNQSASPGSYNVLRVPTTRAGEYFLVENRQLSGFDAGLQSGGWLREGGVAIWHIDNHIMHRIIPNTGGRTAWEWNSLNDTSAVSHPAIKLVEANRGTLGFSQLDTKRLYEYFSPGVPKYWDHYFGNFNRDFNDTSNPSSKLWSGTSSGIEIHVPGPIGAQMEVRVGNPQKQLRFSSATYTVNENDGHAEITVQRTGNASGTISVDYATSNGTAQAGVDYTATSGTLEFLEGEMSKSFLIPIIDNNILVGDRTVNIQLTNPTNGATLGTPSQAVLTIIDDEVAPTIQFTNSHFVVNENSDYAVVELRRTGDLNMDSTVYYSTANGTAQAGVDYQSRSGTHHFFQGSDIGLLYIPLIDNVLYDGDKTFTIRIQTPSNATLGTITTATVTIRDDERSLHRFAQSNYSVNGGNPISIQVQRTGDTSTAATVSYATIAGTAIEGTHYQSATGTLNFQAGESSKTITLNTLADENTTTSRSLQLVLSNPSIGSAVQGNGERRTANITINYTSGGNNGGGGGSEGQVKNLQFISPPIFAGVAAGSSIDLRIEATFMDDTKGEVTSQAVWTSSNPNVATVENGRITGLGAGNTEVTAIYGGKTVRISVQVR